MTCWQRPLAQGLEPPFPEEISPLAAACGPIVQELAVVGAAEAASPSQSAEAEAPTGSPEPRQGVCRHSK